MSRKEVSAMATSSIFSDISPKDSESARRFIDAMEAAVKAKPKKVKLNRSVVKMSDARIKEIFGEK
jgi:molybdenum cofactor biosynthesis enzyme MoaA